MPWAEGCSKQYNHHKRGEIISIDGARCCWFHGSLKCILLRISTIIRQFGGWLKWAPGGESETTGKDILTPSLTCSGTSNGSPVLSHVGKCFTLSLNCIIESEKLLWSKKQTLKSLKHFIYDIALQFSAGFGIIFSDIGGEQEKQDLGVATYRDENHFQDCRFSVWLSIYPAQL